MKKLFDLDKQIKTTQGEIVKTPNGEPITVREKLVDCLETLTVRNREAVSFSDSTKALELAQKIYTAKDQTLKLENEEFSFVKQVSESSTVITALVKHYFNQMFEKSEKEYTTRNDKKEKRTNKK